MDEQTLIKASISDIFTQHGYRDVASMTQRDFEHIGEQLKLKSGIAISATTVKRLANGEFSRLPQIATLNAIANYFDYTTWQDYKSEKIRNGQPLEPINENVQPRRVGTRLIFFILPIILVIAGAATIYFFSSKIGRIKNAEKAAFSFRKNTSNDIPNSVVFTYDIDDVQADSFFIQQSWDINRRVRIYKGKHTLTDIYYEPGYHIAKLIANDSVIRTADVSIPTDRWFFYAIDNIPNYTTEYIKADSFSNTGFLGLTDARLQQSSIDVKKDKRYHYVYFPGQINIPSDNFKFKTRIRMRELRPSSCPYIEIELYCQRYYIIMKSTTPGCAHEASIRFGEQLRKGIDTDLKSICFDVSKWADIEIIVKNKLATVKINGKESFSTRFFANTRNLAGLGFISNGLCEVDSVELAGLDGTVLYKNEF